MRKITLFVFLVLSFTGFAQVSNYAFSQSTGEYSPITGGTSLGDALTDAEYFADPGSLVTGSIKTGDGFSIGFDFVFNGYTYNRFGVSPEGWIGLGRSSDSPCVDLGSTSKYLPLESATSLTTAKIAALAANLKAQVGADLRFETIGTTPNRTLVVQWSGYQKSGTLGVGDGDNFNFQIRLNETTNIVEFIYGSFISNNTTNAKFEVGLRGGPATPATNFINRTSATGWDVTAPGADAKATVLMNSSLIPLNGLKFTFKPPSCGNPIGLVASVITANNVTLNWSGTLPTPDSYEYIITPSSDLPTVSGTEISATTVSRSDLNPNTLYYVYLRSKCTDFIKPWLLAGTFRTKCLDQTYFYENFDSYIYSDKVMPNCWERTGTTGLAYVWMDQTNANLGSSPNRLYLKGDGTINTSIAYAVLPSVSNLQAGTHRLRFKAYASDIERSIDLGYFDGSNNFMVIQHINLAIASVYTNAEFKIVPVNVPVGVKSLVFRNIGVYIPGVTTIKVGEEDPGGTDAYIDDISWEPNPTCADVSEIKAKGFTHNSAKISWTAGDSETAWQYILAPTTANDPVTLELSAKDVLNTPNMLIENLSPSTSYKVWVRSVCHGPSLGAWIGPIIFTTTCEPVTNFVQNFDADSVLPSCWAQVGQAGIVNINTAATPAPPTSPYVLRMISKSTTQRAIVAAMPISNLGASTHRLKLKIRGSVPGAQLDLGYLTDVSDPTTFVYLQSVYANSETAYNEVMVNFGSISAGNYLAFRNPGNSSYSDYTLYVDDVVWELNPSCKDVSDLKKKSVTHSAVSLEWTPEGPENKWQYALGNSDTSDPNTLTGVDFVAPTIGDVSVLGTIGGLNPSTVYKIWVRSKCDLTSLGAWQGPITILTTCSPVASFVGNFDSDNNLPACWSKVGTTGVVSVGLIAGASTAPNALLMNSNYGSGASVVAMQPVSNSGNGTHRLKFKFRANAAGAELEVGYLKDFTDATTFVRLKTVEATNSELFESRIVELGTEPASTTLAFRNTGASLSYFYIDDVIWEAIPTGAPDCVSNIKAQPNVNCGNFANDITWNSVSGADGYKISVGLSSGIADLYNDMDLAASTSFSFVGDPGKKYYYTVVPYNSIGAAIDCVEQSFTTTNTKCYCISSPLSTDGFGVKDVQLGASTFLKTGNGYLDYTSKPVNVSKVSETNLQVNFHTGKAYTTNVWVDYNDNYVFESDEIVFTGISAFVDKIKDENGNEIEEDNAILNCSFTIPETVSLGKHRMRILGAFDKEAPLDPCRSYGQSVVLDFMINVVDPVQNDEYKNAKELIVGEVFESNPVLGTIENATGSVYVEGPACGNYNGDDVWFTASVPASGEITFEVNSVSGGLTNTAAAVYDGTSGFYYLDICDDSSSNAGDDHPKIRVIGRTPGEKLYLRVWDNGGNDYGGFKVSAYDNPTLSVSGFEKSELKFYPNPVNNILKVNSERELTQITVTNILGQIMLSKSVKGKENTIDMSELSIGTYLVKVVSGQNFQIIKIIKN